jgi:DNA-directed RNA polymerase specialized sigma24 family protein
VAKKPKSKPRLSAENEPAKENSLSVELGRIAKLFALYLMKDVDDEATKVTRLNAVGFSAVEIAALLDKTVNNVRTQISQAKAKKGE